MPTFVPRTLPLFLLVLASASLAQQKTFDNAPRPAPRDLRPFPNGRPAALGQGPAAAPPPAGGVVSVPSPGRAPQDRQFAPSTASSASGSKVPRCEELAKKARYGIYFDKVDIEKLVQTVSDATCKTFILGTNITGKISIIGPENGELKVDAEQFYAAFLAALDANNLTVYPHGRFLKIVEKRTAKQTPIPISGSDEEYTTNEQMVTKIFKLKFADVDPVRNAIQGLVSNGGDTISFPPDTLIVNDLGSNIHRLEKILEQLDTKSSSDEIRVLPVRYANAQEVASMIQKIFENKGNKGGRANPPPTPFSGGGTPPNNPAPASSGEAPAGPVTLSQIIPDERTNKLIIMASPAAFSRIDALVREIDVPISGEGRINVYNLGNANAEDMAATLQSLAQGTSNRPKTGGAPPGTGGPRPAGVTAAELFSGEVKISPDKATNALVIVASQSDYRNLVKVIEKLDTPRRQVFVEAVIMEVNLDRTSQFGVSLHQGFQLHTPEGAATGIVGTKYSTSGSPPSFSIANLASYGGFLAGIQGPTIPALAALGIPSFGVVLHAMLQSNDVNILSTPHLLTSDNEEAEITVGQNVPFQAGFNPSSLGGLGATGATGATNPLGSLGLGLGGLGSLYAPIQRQNVELKLTVKPQINPDSDNIRLVINEQTEEIASRDPNLGPTTSKRTAKTTIVAKDQETVVIGGIMQERTIDSVTKIPLLGDLPILGHLFRETSHEKLKTNLLLFLTPYIIRDQSDFRRIFERKMAERQQFVEQFYGQVSGYDVAVDFDRKAGPLQKINQAVMREESKAENGGAGLPGEQVFRPGVMAPPAPSSAPAPSWAPPSASTPPPSAPPAPAPSTSVPMTAPPGSSSAADTGAPPASPTGNDPPQPGPRFRREGFRGAGGSPGSPPAGAPVLLPPPTTAPPNE